MYPCCWSLAIRIPWSPWAHRPPSFLTLLVDQAQLVLYFNHRCLHYCFVLIRPGRKPDTPQVSVCVGNKTNVISPGECESNQQSVYPNGKSFLVIIESSVLSKPPVSFLLNDEKLEPVCYEAGECPGEKRCNISKEYTNTFTDIKMSILYTYENI